jgi:hypothetical protein
LINIALKSQLERVGARVGAGIGAGVGAGVGPGVGAGVGYIPVFLTGVTARVRNPIYISFK